MGVAACAVALVLLMDVSGSVTDQRFQLQRDGTAQALRSPEVAAAVTPSSPLAITAIEWSTDQSTVLPWRVVKGAADLDSAARDLLKVPRQSSSLTALGDALSVGVKAFAKAPCLADRQVIDISGDGATNAGSDPAIARAEAQKAAIMVNGLPIVTPGEPTVADYYRHSVVTPDGFVVEAHGFEDIARAMSRKLAAEIAGVWPSVEYASR